MKINFEYFQIQKSIFLSQTLRAENKDETIGVICLVSQVMVLKLSKKVHFLQFCAYPSKKSKSLKAV